MKNLYLEAIKKSLKIIEVERNAEKAIYDVEKCLKKSIARKGVKLMRCPACGVEMEQWLADIYECGECGNMFDIEAVEVE